MINSASIGKSGSRWLDRLRTAKGFPENSASNLENFLQNPSSTNLETSDPTPTPDPIFGPEQNNEDTNLFNIMSNVLNELFNFGDNCRKFTKLEKSARKQANPRICAFSNNCTNENNNPASEKRVFSRSGENKAEGEEVDRREMDERDERDERDEALSGFSRTEVTVIDTSYETWKFDKLLYRKKNVWKARDKKGKSQSVGSKKKRKLSEGAEEDLFRGKKQKVDENEGSKMPLNEDYNHQSYKPEAQRKTSNKISKILKKKQEKLKLEKGSPSVVIKSFRNSRKKNVTSIPEAD